MPPGFPAPPGGFGPPGFGPPGMQQPSQQQQQQQQPQQQQQQTQRQQPQRHQQAAGGATEQSAEFRGRIALTARPNLLAGWRVEPNLSSQITIDGATATIMGMQLNLSNEIKPMVERLINEQVSRMQEQFANSPAIEQAMRAQWGKMCRSIPLGAPPGCRDRPAPLRPDRQASGSSFVRPRLSPRSRKSTRPISASPWAHGPRRGYPPSETKPECAFPSQLQIVPQMDQGRMNIDVPIDIPFTEVSRLVDSQLKGKTFPVSESGAVKATIEGVKPGRLRRPASDHAQDQGERIQELVRARCRRDDLSVGQAAARSRTAAS